MQINVNLKDPFSYSIIPIFLSGFLILVLFLIFLKRKPKEKKTSIVFKKDINQIKLKYLQEIDRLYRALVQQQISDRLAYQQLSILIKNFVSETTNINVLSFTLQDIEKIQMPLLYDLIAEYYAPEFSFNLHGNIISSIEKTKGVIQKW